MPNDIIQAQYDQLDQISSRFAGQSEASQQLIAQLRRSMQPLQGGGWQGRGSSAFFAEMNNEVLPTMQRLASALDQARSVTLQVSDILQAAEEEASRPFRSDGGPVDRMFGKKDGYLRITEFKAVANGVRFLHDAGDPTGPDIHPNDVIQGSLGDCFLVSSLATLAQQRPDLIRDAVQDNGDGTYTVTFYEKSGGLFGIGGSYKPVEITVSSDLPSGERYVKTEDSWASATPHAGLPDNVDGNQELWPLLIEKAYGEWKSGSTASRGYALLDDGGQSSKVLTALTGQDSRVESPHHYSIKELADMHDKGYGMTISSLPGSKGKDDWYNDGKLVRGHSYWIDSIDETNGTVTIRNPWGYSNSSQNRIVVKYDDLDDYFRNIHVNPVSK